MANISPRSGLRCGTTFRASAAIFTITLQARFTCARRIPTSYGVSLRAMPRNLLNVAEYLLFRRGPFANNVFESAAFVKSIPGSTSPMYNSSSSRPNDPVPRSRIRWAMDLRSARSDCIHAAAGASRWRVPTPSTRR